MEPIEIKLTVPDELAEEAKEALVTLCGQQVGVIRERKDSTIWSVLEGVVTEPEVKDIATVQKAWNERLKSSGEPYGFLLFGMIPLYFYRIECTRGMSIYEEGEHYSIDLEPRTEGHYNSKDLDTDTALLCTFHAHLWDGEHFQLLPNNEWYGPEDLLGEYPQFFVKDVAVFLNLSEQRILQLLTPTEPGKKPQLPAKKRASVWTISGKNLVDFAAKERPTGRPKQNVSAE